MPVIPKGVIDKVPKQIKDLAKGMGMPSVPILKDKLTRFQTDKLVNTTPEEFKARMDAFLQMKDFEMEGYESEDHQRHFTTEFHWGHSHDFGDFFLEGQWGYRHCTLVAAFIDRFGALPMNLEGKRVLDIGCWTGGTSMILTAMGADVVAVEEVAKYAECVGYLKESFGLDGLEPKAMSLFSCTGDEFQDAFDYVLFPGVLYHLTDPILGLRILFNALKDGGKILVETAASGSRKMVMDYYGPPTYSWFFPSSSTLKKMLEDVGFVDVEASKVTVSGRAYAIGRREKHVDMIRAGLSVPDIR